jgi:hypothetical protein
MKTAIAAFAIMMGGLHSSAPATPNAVNWQARTCAQANTWNAHRTAANVDADMTDSFHVPWKYLGGDVDQLYNDVRRGAKAKFLATDVKYIREDCSNS